MIYFPDMKESQFQEKEFMYGILSTLKPDEVRELLASEMKNHWPAARDDHGGLVEIFGRASTCSNKSFLNKEYVASSVDYSYETANKGWANFILKKSSILSS